MRLVYSNMAFCKVKDYTSIASVTCTHQYIAYANIPTYKHVYTLVAYTTICYHREITI